MLRSDHSCGAGVDQLGVGLVAGAERPLDHAGGVVEAAQHPGHVAPRRVRAAAARPAAWPARPRSRRSSSPARCAGSGRGAGRRAPAGRRGRRARRPSSNAARSALGVLGQLGYDGERGLEPAGHRRRPARPPRRPARSRRGSARAARRAPRAAPRRAGSPRRRSRRRTSSACSSGSANRVRTLASARSQPSLAVRRNCWSIASWSGPRRRAVEPRASRRARRRARSRPGSAPRGPRCRG